MENTPKPTITIPFYDITTKNYTYKPMIILSIEDHAYLNIWREKARKLYKKCNGYYTEADEKLLIDPDPFESKWYIFRVKSKSRRATPAPSPCLSVISGNVAENNEIEVINQDLLVKFVLNP